MAYMMQQLRKVCGAQEGDLQMCSSLSRTARLVKKCARDWGDQGH